MRNVSDKGCTENQNTRFVFSNSPSPHPSPLTPPPIKSCCLCDNVVKYCRAREDQDDNMAHAHCMLDTEGYKHTHTHFVQHLSLFPLQQRLHERPTILRHTYISCLVLLCIISKHRERTIDTESSVLTISFIISKTILPDVFKLSPCSKCNLFLFG